MSSEAVREREPPRRGRSNNDCPLAGCADVEIAVLTASITLSVRLLVAHPSLASVGCLRIRKLHASARLIPSFSNRAEWLCDPCRVPDEALRGIAARLRVFFKCYADEPFQSRRQTICIAHVAPAEVSGDELRSRTIFMTAIENTALGQLDKEGRLLNAIFKGGTTKPGRFGFRGDIALKFQTQVADEERPPDYSIEQVLMVRAGRRKHHSGAGRLRTASLILLISQTFLTAR